MYIREEQAQKFYHKSFCNSSDSDTKHRKNKSGNNYVLCKNSCNVSYNSSEKAIKSKALDRSFKMTVSKDVYETLREELGEGDGK